MNAVIDYSIKSTLKTQHWNHSKWVTSDGVCYCQLPMYLQQCLQHGILEYWHRVGGSFLAFCPFLLPILHHLKTKQPKTALSGFCFHCALGSCCKTILWFALMQCSCWEVQYHSSPLNAPQSCSHFPLLPLTKTICNSLISVFRQRKLILRILLVLKCSEKGEGGKRHS